MRPYRFNTNGSLASGRQFRTRHLLFPALLVIALPLTYLAALGAAAPLFELRTSITPADVIVVLGGDGPSRAEKGAAIYRSVATANPRVLVSGDGDCNDIASLMADNGVPSGRIEIECLSRNTWENAKFSTPLLTAMGARSAILVTSWFHMRRAIACFKTFNPQIRWEAAPTERRRPLWRVSLDMEGVEAAKEYLKAGWYVLRHRIALY